VRPQEERFEPMLAADLEEIVAIERDVYRFPWSLGNFQDSLRAGYCAWTLRAASREIVAYSIVAIGVDEAHLLNLSVARSWQRLGCGWRMLDWMADRSREYRARTMLLEVRPTNLGALHLYGRYGFEQIGMRKGYYPAARGREDAIVMRIAL
jgi:ribosomal-protein-alanine N-acetyltransferase